jgi:signal transduction histidine kinase/DNA-binding response OmpR family regulator
MSRDPNPTPATPSGAIGELVFRAGGEVVRADAVFRRRVLRGRVLPAKANALTLDALQAWGLFELMGQATASGAVATQEVDHPDGAGLRRLVLRLSPLEEQGGKFHAFLLQAEDITERREAEKRLAAEREEALRSAETKGEFLASMSHELRTPLNGIIGFLRLVEDGGSLGEEERKDYLHSARTAAMGLLELINNILDLAKIEANRLTLESVELEPLRLAEEASKTLAPQAHAKGVEIVSYAAPEVPGTLLGDPTRLRQVLLNLVGNAVKFTDTGAVTILVTQDALEGNRATIRFAVRDTGVGIPEDVQKTLFQNFVQRDRSISRRFGGTGLGLAICRQLLEQMGGTIGVESREGQGSTFWFRLPLEIPADASAAKRGALHGARLLVLDPLPVTRELTALTLQALGAEVAQAKDTGEAQAALQRALAGGGPIQVVLVDHHLQRDAALSFAHNVRSAPTGFRPDLIYLASIGQMGEPDAIRAGGYSALLTKPVPRAILAETARGLLRSQTAQGSAYAPPPRRAVGELTNLAARHQVRVLVAEDNAVNQKLIHALLTKRGFQVTLVPNGKAAVLAVLGDDFDIVLMDVQMPVMDGLSATQEIRRRVEGRLPIIAMTADTMDGDRERCLAAGMNDYISKPILPDQLNSIMEQWLGRTIGESKADTAARGFADWGTLDHSHLEAVNAYARAHRPGAFAEYVELFQRELASALGELSAAAAKNDWTALAAGARQVSAIAEGFGAPRLQAMARELETHGREGRPLLARDLLAQIHLESRSVRLQLQRSYGSPEPARDPP